MQRRSRKKKAPEPPRFVRKPLGSPKKNNDCRAEQNINTEGASIVARACTENEYEETPRKELLRPPQPAPRKSKLPQTLSSSEEDESEEEQEEDEDEEEEEEEDLEEVKNRVQNQYYNKQTLTLVEGRQDSGRERIEKVEDENEEFSCPEGTAQGTFTKHAHPLDCRQFFLCIGGVPREQGCPLGEVFSSGRK